MLTPGRFPALTALPHTWLHVPRTDLTIAAYTAYPLPESTAFSAVLHAGDTAAGLVLNAGSGAPTVLMPFAASPFTADDFESFVYECRTNRGALVAAPSVLDALVEQHLMEAFVTLAHGSGQAAVRLLDLRRSPTGEAPLYFSRAQYLLPAQPSAHAHAAISRYLFTAYPLEATQWWQRWDQRDGIWADLTNPPRDYLLPALPRRR